MTTSPAASPAALSADIQAIYDGALNWMVDHLPLFRPNHPYNIQSELNYKPLVETLFVMLPYFARQAHLHDPRFRQISDWLAHTLASVDFDDAAHLSVPALSFVALREDFERLTGRLTGGSSTARLRAGQLTAVSNPARTPYRVMDMLHAFHRDMQLPPAQAYAELYSRTLLGRNKPLAHCSNDDLYSLTHTIFYLTNLSQWTPELIPQDEQLALTDRCLAATIMLLRQQNADIAGEFLMCLGALGMTSSPTLDRVWAILRQMQLASGSMVGPHYQRDLKNSPDEQPFMEYTRCYHTTLVMLGACWPLIYAERTRPVPQLESAI